MHGLSSCSRTHTPSSPQRSRHAGQRRTSSASASHSPAPAPAPPRVNKASPSDVIFGRPPGADEAVQHLGPLSSDSSPSTPSKGSSSGSGSGSGGGGGMGGSGSRSGSRGRAGPSRPQSRAPSRTASRDAPASSRSRTRDSLTYSQDKSQAQAPGPPRRHAGPRPGDVIDGGVKVIPSHVDDADPEDIVVLVADMLHRLMTHNDTLPLHPSALTRFHSRATPGISIHSYLRRIAKYTSLDKACTLILLVYIDRVCERMKGFTICGLTVHRFVCAAVVCASKALCDAFSTNGHYARVGGISLVELNMLEKEFLNIIDWRLTCSGALLQHYYASLVASHSSYVLAEPEVEGECEGAGAGAGEGEGEGELAAATLSASSSSSSSSSCSPSASASSSRSASRLQPDTHLHASHAQSPARSRSRSPPRTHASAQVDVDATAPRAQRGHASSGAAMSPRSAAQSPSMVARQRERDRDRDRDRDRATNRDRDRGVAVGAVGQAEALRPSVSQPQGVRDTAMDTERAAAADTGTGTPDMPPTQDVEMSGVR